jgi:N-acyl-D-aspartate/D-glutamate deacylase
MLLVTLANFRDASLDTVSNWSVATTWCLAWRRRRALRNDLRRKLSTYMLTHWVRDRASGGLRRRGGPRADVGARPGGRAGRPRPNRVGYKADLNVVDQDALRLHKPTVRHDLPAGGRRLDQGADGYVATIVSGVVIAENGVPTDARPGKLVRGRQPAPASA